MLIWAYGKYEEGREKRKREMNKNDNDARSFYEMRTN